MEFDKKQAWQQIADRVDKKIKKRRRRQQVSISTFAIILIVGSLYIWPRLYPGKPMELIRVTTQIDEVKQIELADGSKLTLNGNTSIVYPKVQDKKKRSVELVRGEVIFDVAKDASRPFEVQIDSARIEVLGTLFNINTYGKQLAVTLAEGSILFRRGSYSRLLSPEERLTFDADKAKVEITQVEAGETLSWQTNRWVFQETPLDEALTQIAAQQGITFHKKQGDKTYPNVTLYQDKKDIDLPQLLQLLENVSGAEIILDQKSIVLK